MRFRLHQLTLSASSLTVLVENPRVKKVNRMWESLAEHFWPKPARKLAESLRLAGWIAGPEPDRVRNVINFLAADILQSLTRGRQLLLDLRDLFGHDFVRLIRAASQHTAGAGSDTSFAIGGEPSP